MNPSLRYSIIVCVISSVLLALTGFFYTNYVDRKRAADERQNDRDWCPIVVFYDDFYTAHPDRIQTKEQATFVKLMSERRKQLACPATKN